MIVLAALIFSYALIYQNLPLNPVEMKTTGIIPEPVTIINYGSPPVFAENLRFNHKNISYFIEPSCSDIRVSAMKEAFRIFQNKMGIISFYEINYPEADISVGCSDNFIKLGENIFRAGEAGPSKIINTTNFNIIQKGKILLYEDPKCERPVVEIHELGHVFGFDHTSNPRGIMYNLSYCNQKITPGMVDLIKKLYSIKPLPDAKISELSAVKKGRYLDFNITVVNEGLRKIDNIDLTLFANGEKIKTIYLDGIPIGYTKTLSATNIKLPSMDIKTVDFILDNESKVEELNEENNAIQMVVPSLQKFKN